MSETDTRSEALIETFDLLGEWEERYRYLIDLGRKLPELPVDAHNEANKVRGCMSQVWMTAQEDTGPPSRLHFAGDSDAHIVKGLIALLFQLVNDCTPREILDTDIGGIFERLGLESHISVNRRNGFYSMVERIRGMAEQSAAASSETPH